MNITLQQADKLAKENGAKFYYDSYIWFNHWQLFTRFYFKSNNVCEYNDTLRELGHYMPDMKSFTLIDRDHAVSYIGK